MRQWGYTSRVSWSLACTQHQYQPLCFLYSSHWRVHFRFLLGHGESSRKKSPNSCVAELIVNIRFYRSFWVEVDKSPCVLDVLFGVFVIVPSNREGFILTRWGSMVYPHTTEAAEADRVLDPHVWAVCSYVTPLLSWVLSIGSSAYLLWLRHCRIHTLGKKSPALPRPEADSVQSACVVCLPGSPDNLMT